jgi:hypothetical protein
VSAIDQKKQDGQMLPQESVSFLGDVDQSNDQIFELANKVVDRGYSRFEYTVPGFPNCPVVFENLSESQLYAYENMQMVFFDTAMSRLQ